MDDAAILFFRLMGLVEEADLSVPLSGVEGQPGDREKIGDLPPLLRGLCKAVLVVDQELHAAESDADIECTDTDPSGEVRARKLADVGFLRRQLRAAEEIFWASVEGCFRKKIEALGATGILVLRNDGEVFVCGGRRRSR